jgi:hypothetical protein
MITTEQARETLNKYYIEYQWVLDNSKPNYSDDLLDWHSTNIPKPTPQELEEQYSLVDLDNAKEELIKDVSKFYNGTARFMIIKNGATQPILVNQDFVNNLESAIKQAKENVGQVYEHILTDDTGKFILDNKQVIIIKIKANALENISSLVEKRRGYCHCSENYHITVINTLTTIDEIQQYKYFTDHKGNPYQAPEIITIDINGNLL